MENFQTLHKRVYGNIYNLFISLTMYKHIQNKYLIRINKELSNFLSSSFCRNKLTQEIFLYRIYIVITFEHLLATYIDLKKRDNSLCEYSR